MKQATAYGARRITSPIRVIEISKMPSMPRRSVATLASSLSTMPTPNITAKNINDRIAPLLEAAATTLSGTIDSSMSMPRGCCLLWSTICAARSAFCCSSCCASAWSTPMPGLSTLTSTSPSSTAMPDSTTV